MLLEDPIEREKQHEKITQARAVYDKSWEALQKFPASETGKALRAAIVAAAKKARPLNTQVIELAMANRGDEATPLLMREAAPATQKWQDAIDENLKFQAGNNAKQFELSKAEYASSRTTLIGINVLAVIFALLCGWLVTRSITTPIAQAVAAANRLAAGDLSGNVSVNGNDEAAQLLSAMQTMQATLSNLIVDIKRQSGAAAQGDFSRAIDTRDKQGFGKEISETLNQLAATTAAALADIGRIATALANGDLSQKIGKQYPGVFGQASSGVNNTVDALNQIIGEVKASVEAAAIRGDFSGRLDVASKSGYAKELATLLNQLSQATEAALGDISRIAAALAQGDLSQKIAVNYPGVFGRASSGVNNTVDALTAVINEVQATVEAAAIRGDFSGRLDVTGKSGYARNLAELLNQLAQTTEAGLNDVARVMDRVARGDLTQRIDAQYAGIFGQLKSNTNSTIAQLKDVIGRIKESTDLINTAAREISAGNIDLSSRTEEQASSLEETASSMEEFSSTVKQNADSASQAHTLARNSNDSVLQSGQMMQQIVANMSSISESSKKIAEIIGVIDSIAFQTNILALNAAVEAARAGDEGRGFAVVASEVRSLAQRSAAAAREIKILIAESGDKVDAGSRLVNEAEQSMASVVTSFQQLTALITDIASASKEQSTGITQVAGAVGQMDEVTQQNAALVEQAAAAAETLADQTQALVQAVAAFTLDSSTSDRGQLPAPTLRAVVVRR
jgi:methyl-accepting chemotaxis protein